jgi:hypothetical protein
MGIREGVLDRLSREFGEPTSQTEKVLRWCLAPHFEVVAERSGSPDHGTIWIPWNPNKFYLGFGEVYPPGKARHPDTYHASCSSLGTNQTVLCLRIRWQIELDVALQEIRALAKV